eukprot:354196-Chlamydomonas_euryale.AAC.9
MCRRLPMRESCTRLPAPAAAPGTHPRRMPTEHRVVGMWAQHCNCHLLCVLVVCSAAAMHAVAAPQEHRRPGDRARCGILRTASASTVGPFRRPARDAIEPVFGRGLKRRKCLADTKPAGGGRTAHARPRTSHGCR